MLKGYTIIEEVAKCLPAASIHSCVGRIMLRYTRCNIAILMAATMWLMFYFSSCIVCGFESYIVLLQASPDKISYPTPQREVGNFMKDISHAVAAIKIIVLHRHYTNMVTARLLTNCSDTLHNIHINPRENITRTRVKRKAG